MVSCPHPQPSTDRDLPSEFTLMLGPHSSAQVRAMARILEQLGASVQIEGDGGLKAHRPEA